MQISSKIVNGPKVIIRFGGNLRHRLRPETISPLSADLSSTTHV